MEAQALAAKLRKEIESRKIERLAEERAVFEAKMQQVIESRKK